MSRDPELTFHCRKDRDGQFVQTSRTNSQLLADQLLLAIPSGVLVHMLELQSIISTLD